MQLDLYLISLSLVGWLRLGGSKALFIFDSLCSVANGTDSLNVYVLKS